MILKLCKYYEHPKTCTYKGSCAEQALFDKKDCQSKLYYSMWLEQENKSLRNELKKENNTAFGTITRLYSVMSKMSERIERYERAFDSIVGKLDEFDYTHCENKYVARDIIKIVDKAKKIGGGKKCQ